MKKRVICVRTCIVREGSVLYGSKDGKRTITSPEEAAEFAASFFKDSDKEMIYVCTLNGHDEPVTMEMVAKGGVNYCHVDREFVEVLMAEIKEETGLKTEFHESDEKMSQDSIWVYMSEDNSSFNIFRLFTVESYNQWIQRKITFQALVKEVKQSVENFDDMCVPDKLKKLKDYEQVKENLFIRLINFEKNKTELEKAFYKRNGDIALTLYMKIFDEDGMLTSLKVPLQCVERWDLENEDVFIAALKNTASMMPPKVYDMMKMLLNPEYDGEDVDDPDYIPFQDAMGNCLSTGQKTNGAVAIFYPGVARLFCDKINTDELYLVFTSIHEVMVHNARMIEPEDLASVLNDTIKEATPEGDVLTDHIYYYNAETDQIEIKDKTRPVV